MKTTIKIEKEVDIILLLVKAGVRYYEDSKVNGITDTYVTLIPCKEGELWCPVIDIEKGIILNWKPGITANIQYKVCDQCSCYLKDKSGDIVIKFEDEYVPSTLLPERIRLW
jgi:hypothetical protein